MRSCRWLLLKDNWNSEGRRFEECKENKILLVPLDGWSLCLQTISLHWIAPHSFTLYSTRPLFKIFQLQSCFNKECFITEIFYVYDEIFGSCGGDRKKQHFFDVTSLFSSIRHNVANKNKLTNKQTNKSCWSEHKLKLNEEDLRLERALQEPHHCVAWSGPGFLLFCTRSWEKKEGNKRPWENDKNNFSMAYMAQPKNPS